MRPVTEDLLSALFPSACAACDAIPEEPLENGVCLRCWTGIEYCTQPACRDCGTAHPDPLDLTLDDVPCGACSLRPPPFDAGLSMGWYRGPLRGLLRALKFRSRPDLAAPLARRAHAFLRPKRSLLEGLDLVVPVPLPLLRRLRRGYNQSAELASHLAARMRLPLRRRALRRRAGSPPQARLSAAGREANARRGFRHAGRLEGRSVLLLDDVWTTGATMRACARALREAGAERIVAFSLARTPADFDGSAEPSL